MISNYLVNGQLRNSLEFVHPWASFTVEWDPDYPIQRATSRSIGIDVQSTCYCTLQPHDQLCVPTHVKWRDVKVIDGFRACLLLFPRSGLALRQGVTQINGVGVIDEDYIDDIGSLLCHNHESPVYLEAGTRVAQLILHVAPDSAALDLITKNVQRTGGYGSTGV